MGGPKNSTPKIRPREQAEALTLPKIRPREPPEALTPQKFDPGSQSHRHPKNSTPKIRPREQAEALTLPKNRTQGTTRCTDTSQNSTQGTTRGIDTSKIRPRQPEASTPQKFDPKNSTPKIRPREQPEALTLPKNRTQGTTRCTPHTTDIPPPP